MSDAKIQVRQAHLDDVAIIAEFNMALCRETEHRELDRETVLKGVARFLSEPARGRYFVVEVDGQVVGQSAHTFEWSDWRNGEIWWIQSVYIHAEFRSKGLFRALFSYIKSLGERDADCCGIRLYMKRDNETARQSYLRLDFHEAGYEVFEYLFPVE